MTTVTEVADAFGLLYGRILDKKYRKTLAIHDWGEGPTLPVIAGFLLGKFGSVDREYSVLLSRYPVRRWGRIDFVVSGVAVEVAVRPRKQLDRLLSVGVNLTEVKKLMKYEPEKPACRLLVLYDFSRNPLSAEKLAAYRTWRSAAGRGRPADRYPAFNLAYYYIGQRKPIKGDVIRMNIRYKERAGKVEPETHVGLEA